MLNYQFKLLHCNSKFDGSGRRILQADNFRMFWLLLMISHLLLFGIKWRCKFVGVVWNSKTKTLWFPRLTTWMCLQQCW